MNDTLNDLLDDSQEPTAMAEPVGIVSQSKIPESPGSLPTTIPGDIGEVPQVPPAAPAEKAPAAHEPEPADAESNLGDSASAAGAGGGPGDAKRNRDPDYFKLLTYNLPIKLCCNLQGL